MGRKRKKQASKERRGNEMKEGIKTAPVLARYRAILGAQKVHVLQVRPGRDVARDRVVVAADGRDGLVKRVHNTVHDLHPLAELLAKSGVELDHAVLGDTGGRTRRRRRRRCRSSD